MRAIDADRLKQQSAIVGITTGENLRKLIDAQPTINAEILAERPVASAEAISGYQAGKTTGDVTRLLNYLSEGTCKGIKSATVYRIRKFAEEMGLI